MGQRFTAHSLVLMIGLQPGPTRIGGFPPAAGLLPHPPQVILRSGYGDDQREGTMDLVTLIVGVVVVYIGMKQEISGAGLPLIIGGACLALFGAVWFYSNHFCTN
jgi:hypothetical protein